MGKWHYKVPRCGFLDRGLAGFGPGVDAEGVVDLPQGEFGAGGLAHVQGAAVGDPLRSASTSGGQSSGSSICPTSSSSTRWQNRLSRW